MFLNAPFGANAVSKHAASPEFQVATSSLMILRITNSSGEQSAAEVTINHLDGYKDRGRKKE